MKSTRMVWLTKSTPRQANAGTLSLLLAVSFSIVVAGLCGCHSRGMVRPPVVRLDEDGNICDALLDEVAFKQKSEAFVLGVIIRKSRRLVAHRSLLVSLSRRDCRVVVTPRQALLTTEDLVSIASTGELRQAAGNISLRLPGTFMTDAVDAIAQMSGHCMSVDTYSDAEVLEIRVGPHELVSTTWQRVAYQVPDALKKHMAKLPRRLEPTGACMAYDPTQSLLVVIDENDSCTFALLAALGCIPAQGVGAAAERSEE